MDQFISFLGDSDSQIYNELKSISLGGGMFSRMDNYIKEQLSSYIPSFNEYAKNSIQYLVNLDDNEII